MPFKDAEERRLSNRKRLRTVRHGNWRQIYYDFGGICAVCGTTESLEFHAPFSEDEPPRVLMCTSCHVYSEQGHNGNRADYRPTKSMLTEDIDAEIRMCGSLHNWCLMYQIKEHE